MKTICAWCHPGETGVAENVSHGMCDKCAESWGKPDSRDSADHRAIDMAREDVEPE